MVSSELAARKKRYRELAIHDLKARWRWFWKSLWSTITRKPLTANERLLRNLETSRQKAARTSFNVHQRYVENMLKTGEGRPHYPHHYRIDNHKFVSYNPFGIFKLRPEIEEWAEQHDVLVELHARTEEEGMPSLWLEFYDDGELLLFKLTWGGE